MQRPVITSNISPMTDVEGEGAYLADPNDPASIRAGIVKFVDDDEFRDEMIKKGLED